MDKLKAGKTHSTYVPFTIYTGRNIRLCLGEDEYILTTRNAIDDENGNRLTVMGFTTETGKIWKASKRDVAASGRDINVLAIILDGKKTRHEASAAITLLSDTAVIPRD